MSHDISFSNFILVDYCASNPCLNGGLCVGIPGYYSCNCTVGFAGKDCEGECTLHIDECGKPSSSYVTNLSGIKMT